MSLHRIFTFSAILFATIIISASVNVDRININTNKMGVIDRILFLFSANFARAMVEFHE